MRKFSLVCFAVFILAASLLVRNAGADYKQAYAYYTQKNYEKAIQELKPDIEKNPEWEFGHRLLGLCYLNLKNYALAENELKRATQLKSTSFVTYFGLGEAYFAMQKYDTCISSFNQAELLGASDKGFDKQKARLYELRGTSYYRTGKFNEAVEDLTNCIRLDPSDWADYSMLGIAYFNLNRTDEAIQALEKALSMKPGESATADVLGKAYFKKGVAALSAKQYPAATQALLKAKDYDPKNGYIYFNIAEACLFQKKYPDAEKALNQALALIPKSQEVYARMGLVYEKQNKWDLALNAYKKADEINPSKTYKDAIARVTENKKK